MTTWPFKKITIYEKSPHGDALQEVEWPEHHPIGGSETASLRMAAAFRRLGFEVEILTRKEQLLGHACDIFIASRAWQIFHEGIKPGKLNYLWCHDDANVPAHSPFRDPAVSGRVLAQLTGIVFISYYQAHGWVSAFKIPATKVVMSTNGIPYDRFQIDEANLAQRPRRAFYSSTPFRGLNILLHAWPMIRGQAPGAELHVFSSMKVYLDRDSAEMQKLYDAAQSLPGVVYHGSVGQAPLRDAITQCRVLAYPCTFLETSCITAMEAMAAGCGVAAPATGALYETAWQNPLVPAADGWFDQWREEVVRLLVDDDYYAFVARQNRAVARQYDWVTVATRTLHRFKTDFRKSFPLQIAATPLGIAASTPSQKEATLSSWRKREAEDSALAR